MDANLFWTRLNTLAGDLMFSRKTPSRFLLLLSHSLWGRLTTLLFLPEPIDTLVRSLMTSQQQKSSKPSPSKTLYRYNLTLRNPFPGSLFYGVAGHHFVELLFQFMTLLERYPTPGLREISTEFARKLIKFANGEAPWSPYEAENEYIAVVSSRDGWQVYKREEDVIQGAVSEDGGRRYEAWGVMEHVWANLGQNKEEILRAVGFEGLLGLVGPPSTEGKDL